MGLPPSLTLLFPFSLAVLSPNLPPSSRSLSLDPLSNACPVATNSLPTCPFNLQLSQLRTNSASSHCHTFLFPLLSPCLGSFNWNSSSSAPPASSSTTVAASPVMASSSYAIRGKGDDLEVSSNFSFNSHCWVG